MDKKTVKKYTVLALCLILVLAAIVMSVNVRGFSAGAGKGKSETVSNLSAFAELLGDGTILSPLAETADVSAKTFPNMTLKMSFSHYKAVGYGFLGTPTSIQCDMTAYLTENEALYDIELTYSATQAGIYATMEIYSNQERTLIRFERVFGSVAGDPFVFPDILLGKWLDIAEVDLSHILDLSSFPMEKSLATFAISTHIVRDYQANGFSHKGQKYTMNPTLFNHFGAQIFLLEGLSIDEEPGYNEEYNGHFKIDLTSKKSPKISFTLKAQQTVIDPRFSIETARSQLVDTVEYTFCNIGNTAIKMPKNLKTVGADQFNSYMEALQ